MRTFRALSLIVITMLAMVAGPSHSEAASAAEIDADVNAALTSLESQIVGAREFASKAARVLVFPSVVKARLGLGGEYGEGCSSSTAAPADIQSDLRLVRLSARGANPHRDHHVHDRAGAGELREHLWLEGGRRRIGGHRDARRRRRD
jgi:hypothetical protein